MRVRVLSDLHLEFGGVTILDDVDCDLVALAGDIDVLKRNNVAKWARQTFPSREIVWVLGNHEFYGSEMLKALHYAKRDSKKYGVHLLEKNSFEYGGVRILGCTLWTDFALHGDAAKAMLIASRRMNDFQRIKLSYGEHHVLALSPADTVVIHRGSVDWLDRTLSERFTGRTIVVTHHAPHPNCEHATYKGGDLSPAYCSDLGWLIDRYQPDLWISGHTHASHDFEIRRTRLLSNQRGYSNVPEHADAVFKPFLVIEI